MTRAQAIRIAADFHCEVLKLGDGSRLVLSGETITAHYARGVFPRAIRSPYREVAA